MNAFYEAFATGAARSSCCHTPLLRPDDHCLVNSVAILRVRNANPLRAVQQQIGAIMKSITSATSFISALTLMRLTSG